MKFLLVAATCACLVSLLRSPLRSKYYVTALYLLAAIPATVAFQTDTAWLRDWYALLVSPVAVLRFAAGVEVAHRQTEGFRWWWLLMIGILLLTAVFAGIGWVRSQHPAALQEFVELRRLLQIYMAAMFMILELFWVTQGGGWMVRHKDRIAVAFGLMLVSHGAVSVAMGVSHLTGEEWRDLQPWLWAVDAVAYAWITTLFAGAGRSSLRYRSGGSVLALIPRSARDPHDASS